MTARVHPVEPHPGHRRQFTHARAGAGAPSGRGGSPTGVGGPVGRSLSAGPGPAVDGGRGEAADGGNRIAFVFVDLPVDVHRPGARLARIHEQTTRIKREGRAGGGEALLGALGALPDPLRTRAARLAARTYNLVVSNVPGPRFPVYLLGCPIEEAVPVIPISEGHSLSIGVFTYGTRLTFSVYLDPVALPQALDLGAAVLELGALEPDHVAGPVTSHAA